MKLTLLILATTLAACSAGDDDSRIEETVDELVDALNERDRAAVGRLFVDGSLAPMNPAGDSSVVYRLVTIPGGTDFVADNVTSTVIADRAQAELDLAGDVVSDGKVVGQMTMRLGLDLQRQGETWRIIPGSDRMLSKY